MAGQRITVIGAGVIGATIAARLAERGREVVLISADAEGSAPASIAAFGWVNALPKPSAAFQRLNERGIVAHQGAPWFFQTGAVSDGEEHPDNGYVDVSAYLAVQLAALRAAGGTAHFSERIASLGAARERFGATDVIVVAAGADTARLLAQHPSSSSRLASSAGADGFVARIDTEHGPIDRVLSIDGLQMRPDGPGRIAAQSLRIEAELRERGEQAGVAAVWTALREEIAQKLDWRIDETATVRVDHARRTHAADGLPLVGPVSTGVYVALTHSGITLAPLLGELVARDLQGDADPLLADFRP